MLATEIVEHLFKKQGIELIDSITKITRGLCIISTPYGYMKVGDENNENPYKHHLSSWHPHEFKTLGFNIKIADMRNQMTKSIRFIDNIRRFAFRLHNAKEIIAWKGSIPSLTELEK